MKNAAFRVGARRSGGAEKERYQNAGTLYQKGMTMATAIERNPIRNRGLELIPVDQQNRHEEWLALRRGYVCGTDAGAIIGLNPYNSAFSVWAEKTGQVPEFQGNISTRVGSYLEDLVARLFMEETGKKVQRLNRMIVNHAYPWAAANIDREVIGEDAILEIKTTTSIGAIRKFRDGDYPEQWYGQIVHYMAVTGVQRAYLAALENNRELRIFELERNEDEIRALMDAEKAFWENYVLPKKTPPVDGHSATSETIKQLFPFAGGDVADLSDMEDVFSQRKALKAQQEALKTQIDKLDNQFKVRMENADKACCGPYSVTWKEQKTAGLDREKIKADFPEIDFSKYASTSRVFRVTEKKVKSA